MYSTRSAGQVFVLCLLAFFIDQVVSRPDGAPIGACADMVPQHFSSPQSSVSPFTTKAEKDEIWSNGTLDVTLQLVEAGSTDKFKGFLMMAFDNAGSDSAPIGTFNLKDMGQGIDCRNDGSKSAVTHMDRKDKSIVVATWTPPQEFEGSVVFKTTFVKSASTFWVKQKSSVVRVKRAPVATMDETTTTTKSSVTTAAPAGGKPAEEPTRTTPAPIPGSASPIGLLAFYSVVMIGLTAVFMA